MHEELGDNPAGTKKTAKQKLSRHDKQIEEKSATQCCAEALMSYT
jgi:hypothetical protein